MSNECYFPIISSYVNAKNEDVVKVCSKIGKKSRQGAYWTSDAIEAKKAIALWSEGSIEAMPKSNWCNIRPVLALKIK